MQASNPRFLSPLRIATGLVILLGTCSMTGSTVHAGGRLGPFFLENLGQVSPDIRYYGSTKDWAWSAASNRLVLVRAAVHDSSGAVPPIPSERFEVIVLGSAHSADPHGVDPVPTTFNVVRGNDPAHWRSGISAYPAIHYSEAGTGAQLEIRLEDAGIRFVSSGAPSHFDASHVSMRIVSEHGSADFRPSIDPGRTIDHLRVDLLPNGAAERMVTWCIRFGADREGPHAAPVSGNNDLVWGTYLGGAGDEAAYGLDLDTSLRPLLCGRTTSWDFPVTAGSFDPIYAQSHDVWVARLNQTATAMSWCTYVGGAGAESGLDLVVGSDGGPIVTGYTASADFPTSNGAWDQNLNGSLDAFVTHLSSDGGSLVWSTYLGGMGDEHGRALDRDDLDRIWVGGFTRSSDYPTTSDALSRVYQGGQDIFLTLLSNDGASLVYSTMAGGTGDEAAYGVTWVESLNRVWSTGYTTSTQLPATTGVFDSSWNGGSHDAFLLGTSTDNPAGASLGYLGGAGQDIGRSIHSDPEDGSLLTVGNSASQNFPTTSGVFDGSNSGGSDAYVARLASDGSALVAATYVGGSTYDTAFAVFVDRFGNPVIAGHSDSPNYPTTSSAYDTSFNGFVDAVVTRLDPTLAVVTYSTFYGGSDYDPSWAVHLDQLGNILIAGETYSLDLPVTNSMQPSPAGALDAYACKLILSYATAVDPIRANETAIRVLPTPARRMAQVFAPMEMGVDAEVRVIDIQGREVRTGRTHAGRWLWDLRDGTGRRVVDGFYWVVLPAISSTPSPIVVLSGNKGED